MTPQELKNSILQLAIQGKLVEQRPEEGTAEELYEQIQEEKQQLIKEKKIKKQKALPEITEDEIPFDIPDSWKWTKFGDIVDFTMGKTPPRAETQWWKNEVPWISIADMPEGGIITGTKEGVSLDAIASKFGGKIVPKDTLIMSFKLTVGKVSILGIDAVHNEAIISIVPFKDISYSSRNYLFHVLPFMSCYGDTKNAIKGKTLNKESLNNLLIPLPPLAEQKRIVAKIEELLPYIDKYEKAWTKLEEFNKKFPDDMQKSILQMAIQGKLVEQRAEEGTAEELYQQIQEEKQKLIKEKKIKKQKALPEITEDEIPFDIPDSWKWVRFNDVIDVRDGTHDSPKYHSEGVPLITSKNISSGYLDFNNVKYISKQDAEKINERSVVNNGDILFAMIGSIGNPVVVNKNREFCVKNVALFKMYSNNINITKYLYYYLCFAQHQLKKEASGGVQSFISLKRFREYLLPLPPLHEQQRIVKKIELLLPMCGNLKEI